MLFVFFFDVGFVVGGGGGGGGGGGVRYKNNIDNKP